MISGPGVGVIAILARRESSELGVATDTECDSANAIGFVDRAKDVGRAAAGCNSTEDIFAREVARLEVADANSGVIFGGFRGSGEGGFATRDDALHHFGRNVESGRTLGGIENTQASAGAGSYIKEMAAAVECVHYRVDRLR